QTAGFGIVTHRICGGDRVARCQRSKLDAPGLEERIRVDEESVSLLAHKSRESLIDLAAGAGFENPALQPHGAGSGINVSQCGLGIARARIDEHDNMGGIGHQLTQQSQPLCVNSTVKKLIPVRLPPGRARLVTRPSLTGSSGTPKTMGIVVVAALAANAAEPSAAITETWRRTRSAASAGSRSI